MELRQLRYFVAVAQAGGFQKAALRLHVAQPALSKHVKQLEAEIGVTLLHRRPRVRLTPAGKRFLQEATRALDHISRAREVAREQVTSEAVISVGHPPLVYYPTALTSLLTDFSQTHPEMRVRVEKMAEVPLRSALRDHRIDVAFTLTSSLEDDEFATAPVLDCSANGVFLHENDPLAGQASISLRQLNDVTWFHLRKSLFPRLLTVLSNALKERGVTSLVQRPRPLELPAAAMRMATTRGWLLAASVMRHFETMGYGLVYRPFEEPPIPVWTVVQRRAKETNPMVLELMRMAGESVMRATPAR